MTDLVQTLEQMAAVLTRCGETVWSKKIVSDLSLLQKGDNYGAERFLTYFGGMGSINDVWLCRVNRHAGLTIHSGEHLRCDLTHGVRPKEDLMEIKVSALTSIEAEVSTTK